MTTVRSISWPALMVAAIAVACGLVGRASANDQAPAQPGQYNVQALPPVHFRGGVIGDDLYDKLRQAPRFKLLNRETVGSPIELRVYRLIHTTRGNRTKGGVTGLLAASTLGLLPMVVSGEHELVYEYRVNDKLISRYSYRKAITRSIHLWNTKDDTHGLGKDGLEWARSTADQFLLDSAADKDLAAVLDEYNEYFPPGGAAVGR